MRGRNGTCVVRGSAPRGVCRLKQIPPPGCTNEGGLCEVRGERGVCRMHRGAGVCEVQRHGAPGKLPTHPNRQDLPEMTASTHNVQTSEAMELALRPYGLGGSTSVSSMLASDRKILVDKINETLVYQGPGRTVALVKIPHDQAAQLSLTLGRIAVPAVVLRSFGNGVTKVPSPSPPDFLHDSLSLLLICPG